MLSEPVTDADLFDLLHRYFGIGDYEWMLDEDPWHKVRMREVAKIKAIRRKRNLRVEDVALLADYCRRHRKRIGKAFDLLEWWPYAVRERTANERFRTDPELERALEIERARPDGTEWVDRLLRARGPGLRVALDRWTKERGA